MGQGLAVQFMFPRVDSGRVPTGLEITPSRTPVLFLDYEEHYGGVTNAGNRSDRSSGSCKAGILKSGGMTRYSPGCVFHDCVYKRRCLLYFHANGEDLGHIEVLGHRLMKSLGVSVCMVEYPGYGVFKRYPGAQNQNTFQSPVPRSPMTPKNKSSNRRGPEDDHPHRRDDTRTAEDLDRMPHQRSARGRSKRGESGPSSGSSRENNEEGSAGDYATAASSSTSGSSLAGDRVGGGISLLARQPIPPSANGSGGNRRNGASMKNAAAATKKKMMQSTIFGEVVEVSASPNDYDGQSSSIISTTGTGDADSYSTHDSTFSAGGARWARDDHDESGRQSQRSWQKKIGVREFLSMDTPSPPPMNRSFHEQATRMALGHAINDRNAFIYDPDAAESASGSSSAGTSLSQRSGPRFDDSFYDVLEEDGGSSRSVRRHTVSTGHDAATFSSHKLGTAGRSSSRTPSAVSLLGLGFSMRGPVSEVQRYIEETEAAVKANPGLILECTCPIVDGIAKAALHFVKYVKGYKEEDILLYGRSIGTGPVARLAGQARKAFHAVILQSPYYSIESIAAEFPFGSMISFDHTHWNNYKELAKCRERSAICIMHGEFDNVIPIADAERLYKDLRWNGHDKKSARERNYDGYDLVSFKKLSGKNHNDLDWQNDVLPMLERFLRRKRGDAYSPRISANVPTSPADFLNYRLRKPGGDNSPEVEDGEARGNRARIERGSAAAGSPGLPGESYGQRHPQLAAPRLGVPNTAGQFPRALPVRRDHGYHFNSVSLVLNNSNVNSNVSSNPVRSNPSFYQPSPQPRVASASSVSSASPLLQHQRSPQFTIGLGRGLVVPGVGAVPLPLTRAATTTNHGPQGHENGHAGSPDDLNPGRQQEVSDPRGGGGAPLGASAFLQAASSSSRASSSSSAAAVSPSSFAAPHDDPQQGPQFQIAKLSQSPFSPISRTYVSVGTRSDGENGIAAVNVIDERQLGMGMGWGSGGGAGARVAGRGPSEGFYVNPPKNYYGEQIELPGDRLIMGASSAGDVAALPLSGSSPTDTSARANRLRQLATPDLLVPRIGSTPDIDPSP